MPATMRGWGGGERNKEELQKGKIYFLKLFLTPHHLHFWTLLFWTMLCIQLTKRDPSRKDAATDHKKWQLYSVATLGKLWGFKARPRMTMARCVSNKISASDFLSLFPIVVTTDQSLALDRTLTSYWLWLEWFVRFNDFVPFVPCVGGATNQGRYQIFSQGTTFHTKQLSSSTWHLTLKTWICKKSWVRQKDLRLSGT